jgi:uncharacterized membrane protein YqiK
MQFSSALLFSLAQVPINTQDTKFSTTQPAIVAQANPQPTPTEQQGGGILVPVLIGIIVILGVVVGLLFQKSQNSSSEPSKEEFVISTKISNVRTKDFFRAEIEGTVYVKIEDEKKATSLENEEGMITDDSVNAVLKDRFDAAMRQAASGTNLEEIHTNREDFGGKVKAVLEKIVTSLGLSVQSVVIGSVDESNTYNPDNFFDAKVIKQRTESIQKSILETRKAEVTTKPQIREEELKIEQGIRKKELEIRRDIRKEELKIEQEIREEELKIEQGIRLKELEIETTIAAKELDFQKQHLIDNQTLETQKIDCGIAIEKYKGTKENELEKDIEIVELDTTKEIEKHRATIEKEIQIAKIKEDTELAKSNKEFQILQGKDMANIEKEIQLAKIAEDTAVAAANKAFQILQVKDREDIEQAEIEEVVKTIAKEITKLQKEQERAKVLEDITTVIEMAEVERENEKTKLIKENRLALEVAIITELATAEEKRYKAVPITDVDRLFKLIRDELIDKNKLTEIKQVVEALTPKSGVLGSSNIYTFANGNGSGEDINKLMRSTSGMQLIHSLIDGKLGEMLDKKLGENNGENWQDGDNE